MAHEFPKQRFADNLTSSLAQPLAVNGTTLTLATGDGANCPALAAGDFFELTLIDRTNGVENGWEVVIVTARNGDTLTIDRGPQAKAWSAGTSVQLRWNAATIARIRAAIEQAGKVKSVGGAMPNTVTGDVPLTFSNKMTLTPASEFAPYELEFRGWSEDSNGVPDSPAFKLSVRAPGAAEHTLQLLKYDWVVSGTQEYQVALEVNTYEGVYIPELWVSGLSSRGAVPNSLTGNQFVTAKWVLDKRGVANGLASLDENGMLAASQRSSMVGTVMAWAGTAAPRDWMLCQGQELEVAAYPDLHAVIGNTYGGDGVSTFRLPDARGRSVAGAAVSNDLGTVGGTERATLTGSATISVGNLPSHTHTATVSLDDVEADTKLRATPGTSGGMVVPDEGSWLSGTEPARQNSAAIYLPANATPATPVALGGIATTLRGMATAEIGATGDGQQLPISVSGDARSPFIALHYIICVRGAVPQF